MELHGKAPISATTPAATPPPEDFNTDHGEDKPKPPPFTAIQAHIDDETPASTTWLARLRDRYQRQLAFVARRLRPGGALGLSLTATVAALVAAGWAFGAVLQDVLARDELELVDRPVALLFVRHREAWLTRVLQDLTNLGSTRVLIPLILVVGVGWWLRCRTWRPLGLLAAAYAGAELAFNAVKELVHWPRPPAVILLKPVAGLGFPSGHAPRPWPSTAC